MKVISDRRLEIKEGIKNKESGRYMGNLEHPHWPKGFEISCMSIITQNLGEKYVELNVLKLSLIF